MAQWLLLDDTSAPKAEVLNELWTESKDAKVDLSRQLHSLQAVNRRLDIMEPPHRSILRGRLLRYGAVAAIALAVGAVGSRLYSLRLTQRPAFEQCYAADGTVKHLLLPDGTKVTLNGGTTLMYASNFNHWQERQVYLNGEAHFDVVHNAHSPFTVQTANLKVKVLGTQFNVKAYQDESTITTSLERGCVEVSDGRTSQRLRPNEQAVYNRYDGTLRKSAVDAGKVANWTTGGMHFENQPLNEVLSQLGRRFGVKFQVGPGIDVGRRFTMHFQSDESLDDILHVLTQIYGNLTFSHQKHNVTLLLKKGG